ncbi:MAG: EAL domain-containing protein [Clostridia bacterium]|nr:EAL domain-containing protein [Clostridia bacterium]
MARNVLIVEDATLSRVLLAEILCGEYHVLEAANGGEALALLRRHARSVSAVITDLVMPDMDGYELLRRMRDNDVWSQIPVIVATGVEDEEAEIMALSLGANGFVEKPYKPALLLNTLHNTIKLRETAAIANSLRRDSLTGVYNREGFFLRAAELIGNQPPGYYVMSCFDVENFKIINDQHGNDKGDEVLKSIAGILKSAIEPQGGICCRIAADNFAALYPRGFSGSESSLAMQQRLKRPDSTIQQIMFSVGNYLVDDLSLTASAMYDRAVMAKLSVKGRYDLHIAWYDDAMRERIVREQEIVTQMHGALAGGQFETWFQPQYNHATGALIGAEALVRWRHPEKGIISPGAFIPVFERNGFIYALDKFVWAQSCALLRKWMDAGYAPLPVSVNISRHDLFHEGFIDALTGLIAKYDIPISLLRLEITESAFAQSTAQIVSIVKRLVTLGFEVEIDDFGSGYSSLNTLKDVPATILKLDMRFLESASDSQRGGNILQSIVRMSRWLGMSVIAEGVETKEQADYLKSIGCCYVQGYYYAKPMPADAYESMIAGHAKGERLLALETVENLDNNAFWDPKSMDTLIFNSYVGGACIFEYHDGREELLRVNDKYLQTFGAHLSVADVHAYRTTDYMDEENKAVLFGNMRRAIETGDESTCETVAVGLYGIDTPIYIRSTVRVIARAGDRYLFYATVTNVTELVEAQRALQRNAEQLQAIMGNIRGGVTAIVFDADNPRLLFANDQFYKQLGYTRAQFEEEVPGVLDRIAPEDRERVRAEADKSSRTRHPFTTSYRVLRRDGSMGWMSSSVSVTSLPGESEPVQLAVATDVTEELENALKMDELLNAIPGGVVIYRMGETLETLYSSDGMAKLTGIDEDEYQTWLTGDLISTAVYEGDAPGVRAQLSAAAISGDPINTTFRLKHKNGGMVWVEFSATKIREDKQGKIYYGIFTKPAAEAALYQNLVEDSTTAAIIMEKQNRRILYANPAWRRLEGVPENAAINGAYLFDLIPRNAAHMSDEDISALPGDHYQEMHKLSHAGRHVSMQARSLIWNGVEAYVCYMNDESERVERERRYEDLLKVKRVLSKNERAVALLNLTKNAVVDVESADAAVHDFLRDCSADEALLAVGAQIGNDAQKAAYQATFDRQTMLARFKQGVARGSVRHRSTRAAVWYESSYELIENPYSGDIEAVTILRDVSDLVRNQQIAATLMRIDYESILTIDAQSGEATPLVSGHIEEVVSEQSRVGDNEAGVASYLRQHCADEDVERVIRETSLPFVKERLRDAPVYIALYSLRKDGGIVRKRVVYAYLNEHKDSILCAMQELPQERQA